MDNFSAKRRSRHETPPPRHDRFPAAASLLTAPAAALSPGDPMGWVLHTDIVTYLDNHPIRSYNIDGNTYIVAEDLMQYGFRVEWRAEENKLIVHTDRTAAPDGYTADYVSEASRYRAGTRAMPYLYTSITAWIGETPVTGYNIDGYTCIGMDDLAAAFASEYVWDADARELRMTSSPKDFAWTHLYTTPDYDADTAVNGVYAIWQFEKNADGKFTLTHSEGDTNFTASLQFGHASLYYTVNSVGTKIGLAGSTHVYQAPHRLTAHKLASKDFFSSYYGTWAGSRYALNDGRRVDPTRFADYVRTGDTTAVEHLCAESATLRDCLRVYYNDEPVSLIGVSTYYRTNSYTPTYRTYQLVYARSYALDEVDRVRIEFCPPEDQATPLPTPDETAILDGQYMTVEQIKTLADTIARDTTGTYAGLSRKISLLIDDYFARFTLRVDAESRPYLDSIESYNGTIICETPLPLFGDYSWNCEIKDGALVFDHFADGVGWHCVIRETGTNPDTNRILAEQTVWTDQSPTAELP